ncbi:MAG: hypothetical protein ABSH10_01730 [Phycisphaerae bacterium]|jgi:NADH-quinone oxidoreductase subunit A
MGAITVLSPPVAFVIVLVAVVLFSYALSRLAFRHGKQSAGALAPYACGEDIPDAMIQPDYGQFLPFAFFFTVLHVIALMATTVPVETITSFVIAVIYVGCAILGLSVLYSR